MAKENEFYMQLLQQALPADALQHNETDKSSNDSQSSSAAGGFMLGKIALVMQFLLIL